ncbi:hypothetical protein ACJMK2_015366 [Sinanodonta woodiana]|uniref:THUMP domain-containing protein n=1 Tax=Sinanodonta woodiana TaxID=1069815 RepID=A0ABD3UT08_SINWO
MAASTKSVKDDESKSKHEQYCYIEATVTTGFENVAQEDVKEKTGCDVIARRGGIVIHLPVSGVRQVLNLGSIDNLRVRVNHETNFDFPDEEVACIRKLRQYVGKVDWSLGLEIWQQFYYFDQPVLVPTTIPADLGDPVLTDYAASIRARNEPKRKKRCTYRKKKSRRMETEICIEKDSEDTRIKIDVESSSLKETKNEELLGNISMETVEVELKNSLPCKTGHQMEIGNGNSPPPIGNSCPEEKKKINSHDPSKPSFRVTCIRNGEHSFDSMKAAANFGGAIHNLFGWNVDMKNYDIEVVLVIDGQELSVCIALTKESLHKRNLTHFGTTTLRPTIAYNMLRLCKIQKGDVVCDPMCGSGSIPIQAAVSWPEAYHIAGEISQKALPRTVDNVTCLNEKRRQDGKPCIQVETFRWNVYNLPLKSNLVDVFITDLVELDPRQTTGNCTRVPLQKWLELPS